MKRKTVSLLLLVLILLLFPSCSHKTIEDGNYTVECTLTGGSGRASIEYSEVEIKDGSVTAHIIWSSPFYDYMIADDIKYEPVNSKGNSEFMFPAYLDKEMKIKADTVAMSQPHLIEYTLYFKSSTLKEI